MKTTLLSLLAVILFFHSGHSQCPSCSATSFTFDLSASIDTTVSIQSVRNGDCCTGTNCVRFNLTINPGCSFVNFSVANPSPSGSAYYQINCGPQTSIGTPACVVGLTNVCITYCKPGNDNPTYTIVAAGAIKASDDITVREGCTGSMSVSGLLPASINWTSVYPGANGTYDSFLSCTSACSSTAVTPGPGSPAYIDYMVSGLRICGGIVSDTVRIYTTPQMLVGITAINPIICAGSTGNVTLTASATNGDLPYTYLWNTGEITQSINVTTAGTYSVSVSDTVTGCTAVNQSITLAITPLPAPPTVVSNSPVCEGSILNLSASGVAGAIYNWTGPNGFTSSLQNPVINNVTASEAGVYSVTITSGSCTSMATTTTVIVNSIPASPSVLSNSPVCEGSLLNLSASVIPGAIYNWTGPNGFTSSLQNPFINNMSTSQGGIYSVIATVSGCNSAAGTVDVTINPLPASPVANNNSPLCTGSTLNLSASGIPGGIYNWTGPNGFTSGLQNPIIANVTTAEDGLYSVDITVAGCTSAAATTTVMVNPIPLPPTAGSNSPVCAGSILNLSSSTVAGANYNWIGPNGFISGLQNPAINNITTAESGMYSVTVTVAGCTSAAAMAPVIVNPIPVAPIVSNNSPICAGNSLNLSASGGSGGVYNWTGPNGFSSNLQNPVINNITSAEAGVYSADITIAGCTSAAATSIVIVNPIPASPTPGSNSPVCAGTTLNLSATGMAGASYSWTGPNGFISSLQNPSINNVATTAAGIYSVTVTITGCTSPAATTTAMVNPIPPAPATGNNSPVCAGSILNLSASGVAGATYTWTGPNGFTSSAQNPSINNIILSQSGSYSVSETVAGCTSAAANTIVFINQPSTTNAGNNQTVCSSNTFINISGTVSGGSSTGVWSTNGAGSFLPSNTSLNATYIPASTDTTVGTTQLNLTSTNNGACPASSSSLLITFVHLPLVNAGSDQSVCANKANVFLKGMVNAATGGIWTSSGTGIFSPSNTDINAIYIPGASDKNSGNVTLTLTTTGNGTCAAVSDAMIITISPLPVLDAGADRGVLENTSIILSASAKGSGLHYSWTPATYLNNDTILNPVCNSPAADILYTITASDNKGCSTSDQVFIKVLKRPEIPNVFTPNGDGINDKWEIRYLASFPGCTVEIYNRYGQLIFQSEGYNPPWDGTVKGKQLPGGTYYYIINPKNGLKQITGFVDLIR